MAKPTQPVSKQMLHRLTVYYSFLKALPQGGPGFISATAIADGLGWGDVQVRKDLAAVSSAGRSKVGYPTLGLLADLEAFLGCGSNESAVLVGTGHLGKALLSYQGFAPYGVEITAAFDRNPALIGTTCMGRQIYSIDELPRICGETGARIAILTVPAESAQQVCDLLVQCGVKAIWNFAPIHLTAPEGVHIHNENMAASLAVLSNHLSGLLGRTG